MNVGIIGCNGMGALHAQMAVNCGLKVVACGDKHLAIAEQLAPRFAAEPMTDCLALTRRADVDIVAICTPTPSHVEYIQAASAAGKQIFCEKPLGRTIEQCKQALEAVDRAGVKLYVGHVVRFFSEFETMRQQIADGVVGTVGFVKTYRGGIFPLGVDKWFRDYAQSGGVTLDSSIHDFDWLRYVFADVERVYCQALQRNEGIDYSLVTLRMKSGIIATTIGTWAHPSGFRVKVEVCGDHGMITFDSGDAPISEMKRAAAGGSPGMIVPSSPVSTSPYQLEWEDFIGWLEDRHEPRVSAADALEAVRISLAALESASTGEPVDLT